MSVNQFLIANGDCTSGNSYSKRETSDRIVAKEFKITKDDKNILDNASTNTQVEAEIYVCQSNRCEHSTDTIENKHCKLEPLVQNSESPVSCSKKTVFKKSSTNQQIPRGIKEDSDLSTAAVKTAKDDLVTSPCNSSNIPTTSSSYTSVKRTQVTTKLIDSLPKLPNATNKSPSTMAQSQTSSPTTKYTNDSSKSPSTKIKAPLQMALSSVSILSATMSTNTANKLPSSYGTQPTATQTPTMNHSARTIPLSPTHNQILSTNPQTPPPMKKNESPRTLQSEPTFRKWIPPFDIDPMSQTFLRMPFTYQSLQVQCTHGNRPHVKRPMNAFMVWAKKNRAFIAKRFPNASNAEISVRLGYIWNELPSEEQKPYFEEANELKEKHRHENPNWVYQPRPGKKCRKALFTNSTAAKTQPASPGRILERSHDVQPIHSQSAPSSPAVKRPLWLSKTDLTEDELQSRIVEDLLEDELREKETGNPTMDTYIDEWLSPKRVRREERDSCLMNDAMLPAVNDDEQNILEEETLCDGKDFEKYIKQLKTERNNFTKLENNISSLGEEDDIDV